MRCMLLEITDRIAFDAHDVADELVGFDDRGRGPRANKPMTASSATAPTAIHIHRGSKGIRVSAEAACKSRAARSLRGRNDDLRRVAPLEVTGRDMATSMPRGGAIHAAARGG